MMIKRPRILDIPMRKTLRS